MYKKRTFKTLDDVVKEIISSQSNNEETIDLEEKKDLDSKKFEGTRKIKLENDNFQALIDKQNNENSARKSFAEIIAAIVVFWLIFVSIIITKVSTYTAHLSDKVLITILTTTTINILGLFGIVANYLFNKNKST